MGLFDWNKKRPDKSRLDLPSSLSSMPLPSPMQANVPDDIPMQLPKFPDFPDSSNQAVGVPSFDKDSSSFDNFPVPPQKKEDAFSNPQFDSSFGKQNISQNQPMERDEPVKDIKNIADAMTKDPENPFNEEKYARALGLTPSGKQSEKEESDYGALEGEEDHARLRAELTLNSPVYVNVIDFATILEDITEIKNGVAKTNNSFVRLTNITKDKDIQFSNYDKLLEDIQKKLVYVDKALFES